MADIDNKTNTKTEDNETENKKKEVKNYTKSGQSYKSVLITNTNISSSPIIKTDSPHLEPNSKNFSTLPNTISKDPLVVFTQRFTARSWREFKACPLSIKNSSRIISDNYGVISECDNDGSKVLIHYRDIIEEKYKDLAARGQELFMSSDKERQWLVRQVKGCIFDIKTGELICRGFPFTPSTTVSEKEFNNTLIELPQRTMIREWREGTVVRIWTDYSETDEKPSKGIVRVSITRRINALRSKWDGCPSVEEMLKMAKIDLNKLKASNITRDRATNEIPFGTVFVILLVHPMNQVQNPELVEPCAFHLDTWIMVDNDCYNRKYKQEYDSLFGMKRKHMDIGIPKLPILSVSDALDLFKKNKSIYIQRHGENGIIYRSKELCERYRIRGEREHPYHRYVELGNDGHLLLGCVSFGLKDKVKDFPVRYKNDIEALLSYGENLFENDNDLIPPESSIYAWLLSSRGLTNGTPREKLTKTLDRCCSVVIYNMISQLRTKYKKKERNEITTSVSDTDISGMSE